MVGEEPVEVEDRVPNTLQSVPEQEDIKEIEA
jgi:hypothetical protein